MKAVQIHRFGGPEVLRLAHVPPPCASGTQDLVDVTFAGVNFSDLSRRSGGDGALSLPAVLGAEVVGRRRADGRRVAALLPAGGGYAQVAAVERQWSVEVPEAVPDDEAVAVLEQGLTAWHGLVTVGRMTAGETVLVQAAAGGVGHLAIQLARSLGAGRVIGLASTPAKREFALACGADAVVDSTAPDLAGEVLAATDGEGVDLALESVGGAVLVAVHSTLRSFGRVVVIGAASDTPTAIHVDKLTQTSTGILGFWLQQVLDDEELFASSAAHLLSLVAAGQLHPHVGLVLPLSEAGRAHALLADRRMRGKVLLFAAS